MKDSYARRWLKNSDVTFSQSYYGKNPDGSTKMFKDGNDKSSSRQVSIYTLTHSEGSAKKLGALEIGESCELNGRKITRLS